MDLCNVSALDEKILSLYRGKTPRISFKLECRDFDCFVYAPVFDIAITDEFSVHPIEERTIWESVERERDYERLVKDETDKGRTALKQVRAEAVEVASSAERWLRDCLLAAGLLEPEYSVLGYRGLSGIGQKPLAEHLRSLDRSVLVFDTNVFIRNLFSNYLDMRCPGMIKMRTATIPAVIWELERQANEEEKPRESRLARNAFRDIAHMHLISEHIDCSVEETEANPSDRLIRQQIRNLLRRDDERRLVRTLTDPRIFVTFDRINALAAHAEGIRCCSLDIPEFPLKERLLVGYQTAAGRLFTQLAILGGTAKVTCEGVSDFYVLGDWVGKTSYEWIQGLVRFGSVPVT